MAGSKIKEDLTGRQWLSRVVLGRSGRRSKHSRSPLWIVHCRACDATAELTRADILAEKNCKRCESVAKADKSDRFFPRTEAGKEHARRLHEPIWPRVCKTCGNPFTGTARQQYCRIECRPSSKPT